MKNILIKANEPDDWKEVFNTHFSQLMQSHQINDYSTYNVLKAPIVVIKRVIE